MNGVPNPVPTLSLYDTVIYDRLLPNEAFSHATEKHLEYFAFDGLRTLCVAEATISEAAYEVQRVLKLHPTILSRGHCMCLC